MRIISWNCNGRFRNKFRFIDDLKADILVIQECEDPSKSGEDYKIWAENYLWIGDSKNKGLGVFCRTEFQLAPLSWDSDELQLFLPCRINDKLNLVAVWTKKGNSKYRYIGQLWQFLQRNKSEAKRDICAFVGDFNSNACWDKKGRIWNHTEIVRELDEIGLVSGYHHILREMQGNETTPTFYLHRNLNKPYHIDFAFVPQSWVKNGMPKFEIGNAEQWLRLSDHLPIILDFDNSN